MNTKSSTHGFTLFSFVCFFFFLLFGALFTMKIVPMYLQYFSVKSAMDSLKTESFSSSDEIQQALNKKLDIDYVEHMDKSDFTIKQIGQDKYRVSLDYYHDQLLIGNLSLSGHFVYEIETS